MHQDLTIRHPEDRAGDGDDEPSSSVQSPGPDEEEPEDEIWEIDDLDLVCKTKKAKLCWRCRAHSSRFRRWCPHCKYLVGPGCKPTSCWNPKYRCCNHCAVECIQAESPTCHAASKAKPAKPLLATRGFNRTPVPVSMTNMEDVHVDHVFRHILSQDEPDTSPDDPTNADINAERC